MSASEQQVNADTPTPVVDEGPREIILSADKPIEVKTIDTADVTDVEVKTPKPTEPVEDAPKDDSDDKPAKPGLQGRIDELTRARRAAERDAAYWKARADGSGAPQTPAQPAAPAAPKREAFESDEAHEAALVDWKIDQKVDIKLRERQQSETVTRQATEIAQSWQSKVEAARADIADFDSVMDAAEDQVAPHVAEILMKHNAGAKIAHHFAQNPEALEKINDMDVVQAAIEIAEIGAQFKAVKVPPVVEKQISKAPPPAKPIGQGRSTNPSLDEMSMDDYVSQRRKQGASWAR